MLLFSRWQTDLYVLLQLFDHLCEIGIYLEKKNVSWYCVSTLCKRILLAINSIVFLSLAGFRASLVIKLNILVVYQPPESEHSQLLKAKCLSLQQGVMYRDFGTRYNAYVFGFIQLDFQLVSLFFKQFLRSDTFLSTTSFSVHFILQLLNLVLKISPVKRVFLQELPCRQGWKIITCQNAQFTFFRPVKGFAFCQPGYILRYQKVYLDNRYSKDLNQLVSSY